MTRQNPVKQLDREPFLTRLGLTLKGVAKLMICSHRPKFTRTRREKPIVILGNGPSLADTIATCADTLAAYDTMAVNFAANASQFKQLRPNYYILADPHFFAKADDPNVAQLIANLSAVDWPMTLLLPFEARKSLTIKPTDFLSIEFYNAVGIEGFDWFTNAVYKRALGMPRPRNVLIPAIMTAIALGYRKIYLAGADHSWTRTLSVDDDNAVVSIQPHFYRDDERELARIRKEYLRYPLHSILKSFYLAFRSYHEIARFAAKANATILNATPGSFIDAFPRVPLHQPR